MVDNNREHYYDRRRARQINKYAGERCCVCAKYGAGRPFGDPVRSLALLAESHELTLKLPNSEAIHDKCLAKLKALVNFKQLKDMAVSV